MLVLGAMTVVIPSFLVIRDCVSVLVENMACERLLSRFRAACVRSTQARRPTACKIMSHGVLSTLLKDHLEAGGDDPRDFTRKQLSRLQVPVVFSRGKPEPIANNREEAP